MTSEAKSTVQKKAKKVLGAVFIDANLCKGCGFCIEFCPPSCLEFSPEFNRKGYHFPVLNDENACNGCDLCALYCPDFAIFSIRYRGPVGELSADPAATDGR
jgi:2-oxoglutarate ferredoxin oxidoreductase subunit delta